MNIGLVVGALVAALLGGGHCVAMCGGLVTALAGRDRDAAAPLLPARAIIARQGLYHAGRIAMYALLGAALGGAGSAAFLATAALPLQRTAYVASNVLLLALAASFVVPLPQGRLLSGAGARVFGTVLDAMGPLVRAPGGRGRLAMGLLWGLMPCALVYSVLPLALLAGGALQGAAVMLAFGAGTLPALLAGGLLVARLRSVRHARAIRWVLAAVVVGFGLLGLARAFLLPGDAPFPFCLA